MNRILIIGGAGFIGSALCHDLIKTNYNVTVVDSLIDQVHNGMRPTILDLPVQFVYGDCNRADWLFHPAIFMTHFDCIIYLASETGTGQSMQEAYRYVSSNLLGLGLLHDALVNPARRLSELMNVDNSLWRGLDEFATVISTSRIILASSRAVYGDAQRTEDGAFVASKETDVTAPQSIYGATKLAQESLLFTGFPGVSKCALRLQNVYGEGQSLTNPYTGVASVFVAAALNGLDLRIFSDGQMTRDFVHVDDVVQALLLAIRTPRLEYEIINVGSGQQITIEMLAQTVIAASESSSMIRITGEVLRGDIRCNFADIRRIVSMGFKPRITLDDGVARLVTWAQSQQHQEAGNLYDSALDKLRQSGTLRDHKD